MSTTLVDVPADQRIAEVSKERRATGVVYSAEDVRRTLLVVAQTVPRIQSAIKTLCNETVSRTSVFESASLQLRKGCTGSWLIRRHDASELPAFVDERRCLYGRVVISADNPRKWKLA